VSVYFVYRSHYDNPGAFHVKVFPQDTVLEWFQSIWRGIPATDRPNTSPAHEHARQLVGRDVYGLMSLFEDIHQHGWAKPETMTGALRRFESSMYTQGLRFGQHHLQLLTDDDELEMAVYIFDDHYATKNPHRAASLLQQDWKLPDGAADEGFHARGVKKEPKLVIGVGATYMAEFTASDSANLEDLTPDEGRRAVPGVRVQDFPRYLFAVRNRLIAHPDDEEIDFSLQNIVSGLVAVIDSASGDEAAFLTALTVNPDDFAGWCAYSDWRMENGKPTLLEDVFRKFQPHSGTIRDTRDPAKDEPFVQTHVAQASKHVARFHDVDRYHHFILFDDLWANAHRDLAASILRTASR